MSPQDRCLFLQQKASVLSQEQTSVLSQQKTSILSQQKTGRLPAAGSCLLFRKALALPGRAVFAGSPRRDLTRGEESEEGGECVH